LARVKTSKPGKLLLVIGLVVLLGLALRQLPEGIGQTDFRAYWSASYLLAHGENFANDALLMAVQQEWGFHKEYAMKTWNPPWVLVWLIPYTWVGFDTAVSLWLLTNVSVLLLSITLGWQLLVPDVQVRRRWLWLPSLAAVFFPSTIVSLMFGQTNIMVLGGLVAFLFFLSRQWDGPAGLALALTTFKPHLVYLALPVIVLYLVWRRRWLPLLACGGFLAGSTLVAMLLRPEFLSDYVHGTAAGNLFAWETATFVTYLSLQMEWPWIRLIGIALLPMAMGVWIYYGLQWPLLLVVEATVLLSIITMPFGWSYDYVLLLLPLLRVLWWLVDSQGGWLERIGLASILMITYLLYYYQRVVTPSELYFFWVPLVIAGVYVWVIWQQATRMPNELAGGLRI
jgi:hypothetical protein